MLCCLLMNQHVPSHHWPLSPAGIPAVDGLLWVWCCLRWGPAWTRRWRGALTSPCCFGGKTMASAWDLPGGERLLNVLQHLLKTAAPLSSSFWERSRPYRCLPSAMLAVFPILVRLGHTCSEEVCRLQSQCHAVGSPRLWLMGFPSCWSVCSSGASGAFPLERGGGE